VTTWHSQAACPQRPDLPWTEPIEATAEQLAAMLDLCDHCPVLTDCRNDMQATDANIGVRAGIVWTTPPSGELRHARQSNVRLQCRACGDAFVRTLRQANVHNCPQCRADRKAA